MHCYDNVGSKYNLANHCRNKFHYYCSYAFPVQFKITLVCGDWFLNEWLLRDRCVFMILGFLPTKCICRMILFFSWGKPKWTFLGWTTKKCVQTAKNNNSIFVYFVIFPLACKVTSVTQSNQTTTAHQENTLWKYSIDYIHF